MGANVMQRLRDVPAMLRKAGPYVLVEVVLPGGTLIALLMFLYHRSNGAGIEGAPPVSAVFGRALRQMRGIARGVAREWPSYVGFDGLRVSRKRDGLEPLAMHP